MSIAPPPPAPPALTCTPAALLTAILLLDGPLGTSPLVPLVAPALAALEAAGAVRDGTLCPWAEALVEVAALPERTVALVVEGADAARRFAIIWAQPHRAVVAVARADGSLRLAPTDVGALGATLVDLAELPTTAPASRPEPATARLLGSLLVSDERGARAALAAIDDPRPVAGLLASPGRIVRAEVTRTPPSGVAVPPASVTLLDAGPLGLWSLRAGMGHRPVLEALGLDTAARLLVDLVDPPCSSVPLPGVPSCPPSSPPIPPRSISSTTAPSTSATS